MKKILLTGAGGLLGRELLFHLKDNEKYLVYALTSNKTKLNSIVTSKNIIAINTGETIPYQDINIVLHCAFARSENAMEVANALNFTENIFSNAIKNQINSIINISSQSVYGQQPTKWTEQTEVAPTGNYAMAKYASEVILNSLAKTAEYPLKFTNIRLSSLIDNTRFVNVFVNNVLQGKAISIVGGNQKPSFLDTRDAADALIAFMSTDNSLWNSVYNLGTGKQNSILEIAGIIKEVAVEYTKIPVSINVEPKDIQLDVCMDASKFYTFANWQPQYGIREMIISLFEYLTDTHKVMMRYRSCKFCKSTNYPFTFIF